MVIEEKRVIILKRTGETIFFCLILVITKFNLKKNEVKNPMKVTAGYFNLMTKMVTSICCFHEEICLIWRRIFV